MVYAWTDALQGFVATACMVTLAINLAWLARYHATGLLLGPGGRDLAVYGGPMAEIHPDDWYAWFQAF